MKNVIKKMKETYQVENKQTVLQHGLMVFKYTVDLLKVLEGVPSKYNQKTPDWFLTIFKDLSVNLADYKTIKHYCIWHDMGKPFCKPDR